MPMHAQAALIGTLCFFVFFFLRRGQEGGKELCWRDGMGRGGDEYDIIYCIHT